MILIALVEQRESAYVQQQQQHLVEFVHRVIGNTGNLKSNQVIALQCSDDKLQ
jgi:hypothetical protein